MEQEQTRDQGGTVRYHKAEWVPVKPIYPWMVTFVEGESIHEFTAAEGEAMGLVPPEPCAIIVAPDGRRVDVPMTVLQRLVDKHDDYGCAYGGRQVADAIRPLFTDGDGSQT